MTSALTASPSSLTLTSRAQVATDRPARYAKQLVAHMGRKLQADWDSEAEQGYLNFIREDELAASCALNAQDGTLVMEISLPNSPAADDLARIEQVVGIHLARFGSKDSLAVQWQPGCAVAARGRECRHLARPINTRRGCRPPPREGRTPHMRHLNIAYSQGHLQKLSTGEPFVTH